MNGIQPLSMFLFERPKRNRKSRHRFDAVDADQGAEPPGPRTAEHLRGVTPTGFCPAHLAGRGCRSFRSGKITVSGKQPAKKKQNLATAAKNVSPGLQGKAGSRRQWGGLPSIVGGGLGGKAPKSSSTRSKGWRLSWFFFRRRKKNNQKKSSRKKSTTSQTKLSWFFFLRKKNDSPAICRTIQEQPIQGIQKGAKPCVLRTAGRTMN